MPHYKRREYFRCRSTVVKRTQQRYSIWKGIWIRMKVYHLASWSHFEESVEDLTRHREDLIAANQGWHYEPLLYRGLGHSKWELETTLERAYKLECATQIKDMSSYYERVYSAKTELEKHTEHRWGDLPDPPAFDGLLRDAYPSPPVQFFDRAVWYYYFIYLRHHGLPSPLLDWTREPYFAAFFAFDGMDKGAEQVSVYAMLRGHPNSDADERSPSEIPAQYTRPLRRHFAQQGRYSLCFHWQFPCVFDEHRLAIERTDALGIAELVKWNLPADQRIVALQALEEKNINTFSLFALDDSLVKTIGRQQLLFRG